MIPSRKSSSIPSPGSSSIPSPPKGERVAVRAETLASSGQARAEMMRGVRVRRARD
jgi:hypothetical protein